MAKVQKVRPDEKIGVINRILERTAALLSRMSLISRDWTG